MLSDCKHAFSAPGDCCKSAYFNIIKLSLNKDFDFIGLKLKSIVVVQLHYICPLSIPVASSPDLTIYLVTCLTGNINI